MEQDDLSKQLQQTRYVEVGVDDRGVPVRVHRFTPIKIGRTGAFGVINRVTDEVVAQGFDTLSAVDAALTKLMAEAGMPSNSSSRSFG